MPLRLYSEIRENCLVRLSQQPNTSAATKYAVPKLDLFIEDGYEIFVEEIKWKDLIVWQTVTLDGTTGKPTTDLNSVFREFDDIHNIFIEDKDYPLGTVDRRINPNRLTGTTPLSYEQIPYSEFDYDTKLFRVWPLTATGNLDLQGKFVPRSSIVFDDVVLSSITFGTTNTSVSVTINNWTNHPFKAKGEKFTLAGVSGATNGIAEGNLNGVRTVTALTSTTVTFVADEVASSTGTQVQGAATATFTKEDQMIFADALMIEFYATYVFLESDAAEPGYTSLMLGLYESRLNKLKSNNSKDFSVKTRDSNIPEEWFSAV